MAFKIGDEVVVKKTEHEYSNWFGKVGKVIDLQKQGTRQYIRVSFDLASLGPASNYIDVADFRLKKVFKKEKNS